MHRLLEAFNVQDVSFGGYRDLFAAALHCMELAFGVPRRVYKGMCIH
jgi:hypothetical protein